MHSDPIPRPKDLRSEILNGQPILEYYSEPAHQSQKSSWTYLILALQIKEDGSWWKGAGAVVTPQLGLVQTTSIDKEQIIELKKRLESITLSVCANGRLMLDGTNGRIRIHMDGSALDLSWNGIPPEAWDPVFEWIDDVHHLIEEKALDEDFTNA